MTTLYTEKKFSGKIHKHVLGRADGRTDVAGYNEPIYTHPIPNGMFLAVREIDGKSEGFGKTRIAAIIDLIENVCGCDARFIYDIEAITPLVTA